MSGPLVCRYELYTGHVDPDYVGIVYDDLAYAATHLGEVLFSSRDYPDHFERFAFFDSTDKAHLAYEVALGVIRSEEYKVEATGCRSKIWFPKRQ